VPKSGGVRMGRFILGLVGVRGPFAGETGRE
jgi:hypothetical protein